MIHPLYRAHDGLIGMTPEERIQLIDALFAPEVSTAQERRELRLHPELLASQAEFFAKCLNLVKDYLPLVHEPVERIRIELPPDLVQRVEEFLRPFPVVSKLDTLGNRGFGVVRKFRKELFSYSV
jgi:hypothetical protein